jgi:ubiquinone/menaquinone biosynthesis C-methylase UbiE
MLHEAGIKSGMSVADIGCGTGFYTRSALDIVGGKGHVYALDIADPMLEYLKGRKLKGKLTVMRSEESHFPLSDEVADAAVLGLVLHEVEALHDFLGEVHRILRPGGFITGLEWKKISEDKGPPLEVRMDKHALTEQLLAAGFSTINITEWTPSRYTFSAIKNS